MFPNIRAEMARKGITAIEMAERLQMSRHTLTNKLYGRSEFSIADAMRIRDLFFPNCSLEYLFEQDHDNTA